MIYTHKNLRQWLKRHKHHGIKHKIFKSFGDTYRAFSCRCGQVYVFDKITEEVLHVGD